MFKKIIINFFFIINYVYFNFSKKKKKYLNISKDELNSEL